MIYIFLDFDGVLHGDRYDSMVFDHMDKFCNAILPYKDNLRIVISSSWRETYSFKEIVDFFPEQLDSIIVGTTPIMPENMSAGGREREILMYCENHGITKDEWLAIDDMMGLFSQETQDEALLGTGNVLFTEKSTGLTDFDLRVLTSMIEKRLRKSLKNNI